MHSYTASQGVLWGSHPAILQDDIMYLEDNLQEQSAYHDRIHFHR